MYYCSHFSQLSANDFHDIIQLRINVFVVEQNCPYPELDNKDKEAYHVFTRNEKQELVATARILPAGISYNEVSIGRVCTARQSRMTGEGKILMKKTMEAIEKIFGKVSVRISAQQYLVKFYSDFGFNQVSEMYLEDDIPHVEMLFIPKE